MKDDKEDTPVPVIEQNKFYGTAPSNESDVEIAIMRFISLVSVTVIVCVCATIIVYLMR